MPKSQPDRATRDSFAALEVIPSQLPFSGSCVGIDQVFLNRFGCSQIGHGSFFPMRFLE